MDKKEFGDCEWKRTDTKNAVISKTGKNYVVFRGVSNNNKKGTNSNMVLKEKKQLPKKQDMENLPFTLMI